MRRLPVDSSNLASVGYDPENKTLEVEFSSGAVYQYTKVPKKKYEDMIKSPSVGTYFASFIKSRHDYTKVGK